MADILDFRNPREDDDVQEALEEAIAWTDLAQQHFDRTTIDWVALDGVVKALSAVLQGHLQRIELLRMGQTPADRTYHPKDGGFRTV